MQFQTSVPYEFPAPNPGDRAPTFPPVIFPGKRHRVLIVPNPYWRPWRDFVPMWAVVAATHLTTNGSATDGTTFTTASITPTGNRLVLAFVYSASAGSPDQPTLSGNGITWVSVATLMNADHDVRVSLYRGMVASPSAGAVTITHTGTMLQCLWSINEFDGVDTGGTNGSAAVVQSATGENTASTSLSVTLAAFGDAGNATFGGFGVVKSGAAEVQSPGTGFTELGDFQLDDDGLGWSVQTEWRADNDTTVDQSSASSHIRRQGIAAEIKAAAAAAGTPGWRTLLGVGR